MRVDGSSWVLRRPLPILLTMAILFAVGAKPPRAGAEQSFSRSRTLFSSRMDVGGNHSCLIAPDGTLRCWGNGANGRLGDGSTASIGDNELPNSIPPVYLGSGRTAVSVSAGSNHTCAVLDNGTMRCWGGNTWGQLGYGNTIQIGDDEAPGTVGTVDVGTGRTVSQVAAGTNLTCVLLDNGTVKCWGVDGAGQLGYGTTATLGTSETPASLGTVDLGAGRTAVQIAAGGNFICALLDNGTVRCWGSNANGQLGLGSSYGNVGDNETPGTVPTLEFGTGRTAVAISAGGSHACAILDNGTVKCWGNGASGRLGYGNINTVYTPSSVGAVELGTGRTAIGIAAGEFQTCAILDNGTVKCWGSNGYGQLGYGNIEAIGDNETPAAVGPVDLGSGRLAVAVASGENHTCALLDNGAVRCWGYGFYGQLGYGNTNNIGDNESPASAGPVSLGSAHGALEVAAGATHSCALMGDGSVYCWGSGASGRLGYANTNTIGDNETPVSAGPVDLGGVGAVEIAAGEAHTCALLASGSVYCWGSGVNGRLGYGNTNNIGDNETPASAGPVEVGGSTAQITTGNQHTCALLTTGLVRCWGNGSLGRLGYGNTNPIGDNETPASVAPVEIGGPGVIGITGGGFHTCAMLADGTVRCWGYAASGALGYGNTNAIGDTETPASAGTVSDGGSAVRIATGGEHTCVTFVGGTVRCWGYAAYGQLGYANTTNIGDNELPSSVGLVQVGSQTDQVTGGAEVTAGQNDSCALIASGVVKCWGNNEFGQLGRANTSNIGDNELPSSVGPIDVGGSVRNVAVGNNHVCVVLTEGNVRCWGLNTSGQLGNANTVNVGDNETPVTYGPADLYDDPPVAVNDTATATEDSVVAIDVLANDTDVDGGPKLVESKTNGTHGTVAISGAGTGVTYTPEANFCGSDSFTYTLNGGSSAAVAVSVACVDDAPVAVNDSATVVEDSPGTAIDVLSNDTDIDGGPKFIASKTNGTHGGVAITGGGTGFVYTPEANYCGPDSFTYELNGGSKATVSVNVACVDDPPVAVSDSKALFEDAGATAINVLANDTDVDGGPKFVASKTNAMHGTVAIKAEGAEVSYAPDANYCGEDSFTYTLNGGSTATVSISVTCVDDPPIAVNDSKTLAEDAGATAINVLANDTDVDGGTKEVVAKTNGAHGAVAITGGGTGLTYSPEANFCGEDSFTYELNGGSTATVAVTVMCVDDPPAAVADAATLPEDASAQVIDVLANDTDIDGGPKFIASKTNGSHGTVSTIAGGAGLTYTPEPNYCGEDSFTYTLNGGSKATVSISVTCVDDPPVAVNDSKTLAEDAAATPVDVLANDTDIDGGPKFIVSRTHGSHGSVAITGGGTGVSYTPDPNFCGEDSFTYTLNGGSTATVSVTVTCVDDPPVAVNDAKTLIEDSGATEVNVLANDTDIDGGPRQIVAKTNGAHGAVSIAGSGSALSYTPDANYCGEDSFTYELNGGSKATVSITVACVDDPPVAVNDAKTLAEDAGATEVNVLANDTDIDGGPKQIIAKTNGSHGTVATTAGGAALAYTPDPNFCGEDSFTYELNGGSTGSVSVSVTCVDDPPVAVNDTKTITEDAAATEINVLANDTDIDGGPKEIAGKANGSHGAVSITGSGSALSYTPDANFCGEDSFTYELNGGSKATVTVSVACVDDAPVAINDAKTLTEDAGATAINVLANDTDVDGGTKEVVAKTNGAHGAVAITANGSALTYTPEPNYCGEDSFTYELNGGSTGSVSVSVTCVDDPPTAVADVASVGEDSVGQVIDALSNDPDVDGGPKYVVSKTDGSHGTVGAIAGGAALTYTPEPNYCGEDSFTYTLNGGSTASVSINVTCVDDPPRAVNDYANVAWHPTPTAIDVLANDTDIDGGPKRVVAKTNGSHGTVAIANEGDGVTYAPEANYCGSDSFTYELNGGSMATVWVSVTCASPPTAVDDTANLKEDASATRIDALANDSNPGGGAITIAAASHPAHGTAAISSGGSAVTYTPDQNYCGQDSFTYMLNGGSEATVSVTVECVDDPPVAVHDSIGMTEDGGVEAIDVLANDTDIDGGPKSVVHMTGPAHGTGQITGGGAAVAYAPDPNYCGPDFFTYELNGGSSATVSVSVACVDDPPVAVPDSETVAENSPAQTIDVLANDTDIDGGPMSIAGRTNGSHGQVTIIGAGAGLTYAPNQDYCGPDSFRYTLNGGSTATVSITVPCVEQEPSGAAAGDGREGESAGTAVMTSPTPAVSPSLAPALDVAAPIRVLSGRRHPRVALRGPYAFFTLTCEQQGADCAGNVRIAATVPSSGRAQFMQRVLLVEGTFRIAARRSVLVCAEVTARGKQLLESRRSLRGVAATMEIISSGSDERGAIEVNLVRRPKASVLPHRSGRRGRGR